MIYPHKSEFLFSILFLCHLTGISQSGGNPQFWEHIQLHHKIEGYKSEYNKSFFHVFLLFMIAGLPVNLKKIINRNQLVNRQIVSYNCFRPSFFKYNAHQSGYQQAHNKNQVGQIQISYKKGRKPVACKVFHCQQNTRHNQYR